VLYKKGPPHGAQTFGPKTNFQKLMPFDHLILNKLIFMYYFFNWNIIRDSQLISLHVYVPLLNLIFVEGLKSSNLKQEIK
jgi:hypothetical protein